MHVSFQSNVGLSTKSLETLGVASVHMYVHPYMRDAFSRKPFITFSETLHIVRACKREKNVPSTILKIFWPFRPKMTKNRGFFQNRASQFSNFFARGIVSENDVFTFLWKF